AALELARVVLPAVDLAVVQDPDRAVVACHRLVGNRSRVDDRQAGVNEADLRDRIVGETAAAAIERGIVLCIGTAACERRTHLHAHIGTARCAEMAGDAAHQRWPSTTRVNTACIASSMRSMPKFACA